MANYDLLVIGTGPAGQKAAVQAAKLGKKVGIVERREVVGGVCINTGTIPSKSLREAVLYLSGFRQRGIYGDTYRLKKTITIEDLAFRANHVIKNNAKRRPKSLWSERGDGDPISEIIVEDDRAEAQLVADEIWVRLKRENRPWKDFAVLYRSNAQSRSFEEAFRRSKIPYNIVGGSSFLERRDLIVGLLNKVPGVTCKTPGGAFYAWPNVTEACRMIGAEDSEVFRKRLLNEAGVAVLADIHFGARVAGEGQHIRFSYAASRDAIEKGVARMADLVRGGRR